MEIEQVSEEELLERITPDEEGQTYYECGIKFLKKMPQSSDGWIACNEEISMLILKGEVVIPEAVEVVKKFLLK